jgi:putative ABC transport system permease protein
MFDSLKQDITYAFRTLRRNPGFTAVAVITLALGIGANTAIFSIVNPFLFRPLPFEEPDRLVHLFHTDPVTGWDQMRFSYPQYLDYKEQHEVYEDLAAYNYTVRNITGSGEPWSTTVGRVSANTLDLLGVRPALGRGFLPGEDQLGQPDIAILGHGIWQSRFGGDPSIVGQTINLDGAPHEVVGVMPRNFNFPYGGVKMWTTLRVDPSRSQRHGGNYLVIGRLRPGAKMTGALAEMETIHQRLAADYPDDDGRFGVNIIPLRHALLFYYDVISAMLLLQMAAVGFALLIVTANVANLLLARGSARQREVAIRSAIGSSRRRLVRQFLTESGVLALLGGAVGLVLAFGVVRLIGPALPEDLYRVGDISVDRTALLFTLLVCAVTTLLFGLAPALQATRLSLSEALSEGGRGGGSGRRGRFLRGSLVVSQVSLALVLLIGATAMVQSAASLRNVDPGFDPAPVLTLQVVLPSSEYSDQDRRIGFHDEAIGRLEAVPGVEAAAAVCFLPLNHATSTMGIAVEGKEPPSADEPFFANDNYVTASYFDAMGIPLLRGRTFSRSDNADAPDVIVINRTMAERFWPGENPIGRRIQLDPNDPEARWTSVVGVVGDVKHRGLQGETWNQLYVPQSQSATRYVHYVIRSSGDPAALTAAARDAIWSVNASQPISGGRTMSQVVAESTGPFQMAGGVLGTLALATLVLACVGIYGVVAYSVSRRVNEIGIRMALGAEKGDVLWLVVKQGATLTGIGVAIGLAISIGLTQVLASVMEGAAAANVTMLIGASAILAAVALLASYLPARRAARIEPVQALRYE